METLLEHPARLVGVGPLNLAQTLDCGQCFRWVVNPDGSCRGIVGRMAVTLSLRGEVLEAAGVSQEALAGPLARYLALDVDYGAIQAALSEDPTMAKAIAHAPGIRVLRQDGWEALCSFIISQNNNIIRIKGIVERLCAGFGEEFAPGCYTFPLPKALAGRTVEELGELRSGFRARYILDAAQKVAEGRVDLAALPTLPLEEARRMLMEITGVGVKVADCALLYGFGRMECFPADVWINRVLARLYPGGLPGCILPYGGIAQQYLFHYARTCPGALD